MAPRKRNGGKKKATSSTKQANPDQVRREVASKQSEALGAKLIPLAVLAVAIAIGLNHFKSILEQSPSTKSSNDETEVFAPPDTSVQAFLDLACQQAACPDSLILTGRSFRATRDIQVGEKLFEVPRSIQIWDLEALRDPFVRDNLFGAKHKLSNNRVGSQAYLAAYIAMQLYKSIQSPEELDPIRLAYLKSLPTLSDLSYHPVLWDQSELDRILGTRSSAHHAMRAYSYMIDSEYEALSERSSLFAQMVTKDDYTVARINVLTRAYSMGPPSAAEAIDGQSWNEELSKYRADIGLDLMDEDIGCHALVPIADLFNHHPSNNVGYKHENNDPDQQNFVLKVLNRKIIQGTEPYVTYGELTDSRLFARYGFVNGDGSGKTQARLAFHHQPLKTQFDSQFSFLPYAGSLEGNRRFQRNLVVRYLLYDDGYIDCIQGPDTHPEQAELKRLKLEHLVNIADDPDRWNTILPPRNAFSLPAASIHVPITYAVPGFLGSLGSYSLANLLETCRLMSLINSDFDGKAIEVLKENLSNQSFVVGRQNEALEFRATVCVGRWIGADLWETQKLEPMKDVIDRVQLLNEEAFGSRNWTVYHVKLGEIESAQMVYSIISRMVIDSDVSKEDDRPEFSLRDKNCPPEFSNYLLN